MHRRFVALAACAVAAWAGGARAQPGPPGAVLDSLDRHGRVVLTASGVEALKWSFALGADTVEAIVVRPLGEGRWPGVLLIPGYGRTARDYVMLGARLAREGYACASVSARGFGRSSGAPDFVGPATLRGIEAAFERLRREPFVDSTRMGVFGYSRGAMAASLLATRRTDLRAAVFAAGIYDLAAAEREITIAGIRDNIHRETGGSEAALRERSSIHAMERLACPVLILHGERDANAPVSQAKSLAARLVALGKPHELELFPDREHDLGMPNVLDRLVRFFAVHLRGVTVSAPPADTTVRRR